MGSAQPGLWSTATVRDRLVRVRDNVLLALQTGCAAGLAWWVAHDVVGHPEPFFAPVAAVTALGTSLGQRLRRVVTMVVGVALGILVGDALILAIGTGPVQVGAVVTLAVVIAIFLRGGSALVIQAAASAVLIATLQPPTAGLAYPRFLDALVGGGIGIAVTALLLPFNPVTAAQRAARPLLDALADGLDAVADALGSHNLEGAEQALVTLRGNEDELNRYRDALSGSREAVTLAPVWWRMRGLLSQYVDAAPHLDHALRNARVLARRAVALIRDAEPVPAELVTAVRTLATAVRQLRQELERGAEPVSARDLVSEAVRTAAVARAVGLGFSGTIVVGQIRFIATDLLRAAGLPRARAERIARVAVPRASPTTSRSGPTASRSRPPAVEAGTAGTPPTPEGRRQDDQ